MARSEKKLKLLYVLDTLRRFSDEENPINAVEICEKISAQGISAERKSVYDDIEALIDFGYDIIKTTVPKRGYFLAGREFEPPEIYLLTDAVRAANFISAKKTRELTKKLGTMLSIPQAARREKGIYMDSANKCKNEQIYYSIDSISRAISSGRKVRLKYSVRRLNEDRETSVRTKEMVISPYAMTWQDDHYYLIGNYEKYDNLIHLRIDRMRSVEVTGYQSRHFSKVSEYKDFFDVSDYTKKLFGMHGGELCEIELRCSNQILEQIIDRFTEDIFICRSDDTHFTFTISAALSEALITFIMNYALDIEVVSPEILRERIADRAEQILSIYRK